MATCPECDSDVDVDEYDVDKGDLISCPECGTNLEVVNLSPLEFEAAPDEDDEDEDDDDEVEEDDDVDDDDDDDEDEDEDEETGSGDWDEGPLAPPRLLSRAPSPTGRRSRRSARA